MGVRKLDGLAKDPTTVGPGTERLSLCGQWSSKSVEIDDPRRRKIPGTSSCSIAVFILTLLSVYTSSYARLCLTPLRSARSHTVPSAFSCHSPISAFCDGIQWR